MTVRSRVSRIWVLCGVDRGARAGCEACELEEGCRAPCQGSSVSRIGRRGALTHHGLLGGVQKGNAELCR